MLALAVQVRTWCACECANAWHPTHGGSLLHRQSHAIVLREHEVQRRKPVFILQLELTVGSNTVSLATSPTDVQEACWHCWHVPRHLSNQPLQALLDQQRGLLDDQLVRHASRFTSVLAKFEDEQVRDCSRD